MKMVELKRVFSVPSELNGPGPVMFAWHPDGSYLACAGASRIVNISNRQGSPIAEIPLSGCVRPLGASTHGDWIHAYPRTPLHASRPSHPHAPAASPRASTRHARRAAPLGRSACLALDWDKDGEVLAVLQRDTGIVPLWDANQHKVNNLDTNMKDLTFLKWSLTGPQVRPPTCARAQRARARARAHRTDRPSDRRPAWRGGRARRTRAPPARARSSPSAT